MESKITELTEKLYKEGVEKGEEESKKIMGLANEKAKTIVADARKEADKIIAGANKKAEEQSRNVESDIKLAGQQSISAIKQNILNLIVAKAVDDNVSACLDDSSVMQDFLQMIIENWKTAEGSIPSIEVLLPEKKRSELEKSLQSTLQKLLKNTLEISFSKNLKGGFQIGPKESSFKISLTDDDFSEFFKEYLRPKTRTFLFGE